MNEIREKDGEAAVFQAIDNVPPKLNEMIAQVFERISRREGVETSPKKRRRSLEHQCRETSRALPSARHQSISCSRRY
jgi:hypothetical protein